MLSDKPSIFCTTSRVPVEMQVLFSAGSAQTYVWSFVLRHLNRQISTMVPDLGSVCPFPKASADEYVQQNTYTPVSVVVFCRFEKYWHEDGVADDMTVVVVFLDWEEEVTHWLQSDRDLVDNDVHEYTQ